jgi:hypothetical protein
VFFIVLSCLLVIFYSTDTLHLSSNRLTGMIPSQIALMSNLCKSSVVRLLVVMIVLSCVFRCTLMLACHIHSTAGLSLSSNSLTGTIPSEVGLLTKLSKSSVVWLLVVMIVLSCVFQCTLMLACHIHSTDWLSLYDNNFTGEFTCPAFIDYCRISCDDYFNNTCRSL